MFLAGTLAPVVAANVSAVFSIVAVNMNRFGRAVNGADVAVA